MCGTLLLLVIVMSLPRQNEIIHSFVTIFSVMGIEH